MSLFLYLKYGGTDLTSEEELSLLPEDLIQKYYNAVHGEKALVYDYDSRFLHQSRCRSVALYSHKVLASDPAKERCKSLFIEALKEWEE